MSQHKYSCLISTQVPTATLKAKEIRDVSPHSLVHAADHTTRLGVVNIVKIVFGDLCVSAQMCPNPNIPV